MQPIIPTINPGETGLQVTNLQDALLRVLEPRRGTPLPATDHPSPEELKILTEGLMQDRARAFFGEATAKLLMFFQVQQGLGERLDGVVEDRTAAKLNELLKELGGVDEPQFYVVSGQILFDNGLPADGVTLRLYNRRFGGEEVRVGEITTDEKGSYTVPYTLSGKGANLEVRTVDSEGHEISLSATKFNAEAHEVLNLVVPERVRPLAPEYERLAADLGKELGDLGRLADARESAERQDLTFLRQATGWDARLIALAATTAKLSGDTRMSPEVLYALARVGLPTDKQQLAHIRAEVVEQALQKAQKAGIVKLDNEQIIGARAAFEQFAQTARLSEKIPGALSSLGDLLSKAKLTDEEQQTFAGVYLTHRGEAAELWQKAEDQGIPREKVNGLRLQGKLAFLTRNNATLTESLQQEIGSSDRLAQLVEKDLHQSVTWKARLSEMAGGDERTLDNLIPPAYTGTTVAERLDAYATDLAGKVRMSFPTQVVGRMVEKGELHLGEQEGNELKASVGAFLKNAGGLGFEMGRVPVGTFVRENNVPVDEVTLQSVKQLTRIYQITPSDEALKIVSREGFKSAQDIVAFSYDGFLERYGGMFPTREEAQLVHRKAQQVSAVTQNLVLMAGHMDIAPPMYALSPLTKARELAKSNLIKHYPTMESLFGSLDFCECEHCRSVLSPAAYFVDLLQSLDRDKNEWNSVNKTPFEALTERRPDLPHLPLSCENTNTLLPYIDVVNEILEYYVANGKLDDKAVHDTGEATTPELLAEPQNMTAKAYHTLKDARYPLALPFDLWLETVREFCHHFETPVWQVLEVFRPTDALFSPIPPAADSKPYDRAAIFAEYLGISPTEYAIFTGARSLATWHELYGFDDPKKSEEEKQRGALAALRSAKTLSGRLGISYKELIDLVRTSFVNPKLDLLIVLSKLGVTIGDVLLYQKNKHLLGFQQFIQHTATALREREIDESFEFLLAANGDLFAIQKSRTGSRSTEVHVLSAESKYQKFVLQTGTVLPETDETFEFLLASNRDLFVIQKNTTGSTTVQVLSAESKYRNVVLEAATALRETDETYEFLLAANRDLFVIQKSKTGSHSTEVRVLSAESEYKKFVLKTATALPETDETFEFLLAPNRDLFVIQKSRESRSTEVHVLSAQDESTLSPEDQQRRNEAIAFVQRLDDLSQTFQASGFNARTWLNGALNENAFDLILVLDDPETGCNFDLTSLRYANGNAADAIVFLKMNLFVRLWRRLGWTMEETDRALQVFVPKDSLPLTVANLGTALTTALVYLAHLKALDKRVKAGKKSRLKLLALWSNLATTGKNPLYAQLFLTQSILKNDAVFDDPLGNYLSSPNVFLKDHGLAVQGALNLTDDEIGRILTDAGKSVATAKLSLDTVSLLYRYGLLAKALNLSIRDLISLKQLSGLDPFKLLTIPPVSTLEKEHPWGQTLRFVEVAGKIKESELTIEDLDYLLRHRFDETGKYRPNNDAMLVLLKTLSEGIRAIRADHAVSADPGEDTLRQMLGLALPSEVVERSLAMLNGTVEFTATKTGVQSGDKLAPAAFKNEPAIREVSYNDTRQEQKLTFRGVLLTAEKDRLTALFPSTAFSALLDDIEKQARLFFDNQLQRQKLRLEGEAGFLDHSDFKTLVEPLKPLLKIAPGDNQQQIDDKLKENEKIERENQATLQGRRDHVAQAFLPFLQQRLIRQFIVQTMTAYTGADPALVEALLTDTRLLGAPQPLLAAFTATAEGGLTATFFASLDGSGVALGTSAFADADTGLKDKDGSPLKPAGANSARFEGYLQVPAPGAYRFYVALGKQGAEAELRFDDLPTRSFLSDVATKDADEIGHKAQQYLELRSGVPYRFTLLLRKLNGGEARLLVQGETLPKDRLAQLTLYPLTAIEHGERALVLLTKTLHLIQSLGLTEREVRHVLTNPDDFDNLDLSRLPTGETDDSATVLFGQVLRLADYVRLKRGPAGGTDDLIGVFETARYTHAETDAEEATTTHFEPVAQLMGRDTAIVRAAFEGLGFASSVVVRPDGKGVHVETPDLAQEKGVGRLWEALQIVERLGIHPDAVIDATSIVATAPTTPLHRFDVARNLRNAVKARYESENWQRVAQPIFDKLRQRQRDALVACIMAQENFERIEQLFEYFLIDPGMEPVVQTSRLRLAISSVQTFIQRCLLNLEKDVHPSAINSEHWRWMKRYRVWEANRKIFLFPENFLEPEFRDDKTHLYQELEGALLQGDISNDLAEDAFLQYLKKLGELARLDIVSMYCEEKSDSASNILHVIGRTYSLPHKYFYRRYAHHMWTPWEPVTTEIGGDHVVAVVWRQRLHLFWVTFLEKGKQGIQDITPAMRATDKALPTPTMEVKLMLNWSECFQGQWTPVRVSDLGHTVDVDNRFNSNDVSVSVDKWLIGGVENVIIHLSRYDIIGEGKGFSTNFLLKTKNGLPEVALIRHSHTTSYSVGYPQVTQHKGSGKLKGMFPTFAIMGELQYGEWNSHEILAKGEPEYRLTINSELEPEEWPTLPRPFFYQDSEHTFFAEAALVEATIEQYEKYGVDRLDVSGRFAEDYFETIPVKVEIPLRTQLVPIDVRANFKMQIAKDWLTNAATVLQFDEHFVGEGGGLDFPVVPAGGRVVDGPTGSPINR